MRATSSSAVRRPPVLLEIVPPVATRRTRGRSCATADAADARQMRSTAAVRETRARMSALYLRAAPRVIEREPLTQVLDGFVGGPSVERHHRAGSAGGAGDLCAELVCADRRYLDVVFAAIDRLVEALHGHGGREHCVDPAGCAQAKGSAKAHPHAARRRNPDQRSSKFLLRVRISTSFPPFIHTFSTGVWTSGQRRRPPPREPPPEREPPPLPPPR